MHILEEWRIRDIEQKAERAISRLYEIDALHGDVCRLEHSLRETRAEVDGLRAQLSTIQDSLIPMLQQEIERLSQPENA